MRTMHIIVVQLTSGFRAYLKNNPRIWEVGETRDAAIGKLIVTYAQRWQDRWPWLKVEEVA